MGRFYTGDIDGKFWFAVQGSDDATYFGCEDGEVTTTNYYVEDIKKVEDGLGECKKKLKGFIRKLDKFFKENDSYDEDTLSKYLNVNLDKTKKLLTQYARLELGNKIYNCVKNNGSCSFEAEH